MLQQAPGAETTAQGPDSLAEKTERTERQERRSTVRRGDVTRPGEGDAARAPRPKRAYLTHSRGLAGVTEQAKGREGPVCVSLRCHWPSSLEAHTRKEGRKGYTWLTPQGGGWNTEGQVGSSRRSSRLGTDGTSALIGAKRHRQRHDGAEQRERVKDKKRHTTPPPRAQRRPGART